MEIVVTAIVTGTCTLVVSYIAANHALRNALEERKFARAQDLEKFSEQQEVAFSDWSRKQDQQFTNWLREQAFLTDKERKTSAEADRKQREQAREEREEWYKRQEAALSKKLDEIRYDHSVGQEYWVRQQDLLFLKERHEKQAELHRELVNELIELTKLRKAAVQNRLQAGAYAIARYKDPKSLSAWLRLGGVPGFVYYPSKDKLEWDSINSAFEDHKVRMAKTLNAIQYYFDVHALWQTNNYIEDVFNEPLLCWTDKNTDSKDPIYEVLNNCRGKEERLQRLAETYGETYANFYRSKFANSLFALQDAMNREHAIFREKWHDQMTNSPALRRVELPLMQGAPK